jgi:hypothetical protein
MDASDEWLSTTAPQNGSGLTGKPLNFFSFSNGVCHLFGRLRVLRFDGCFSEWLSTTAPQNGSGLTGKLLNFFSFSNGVCHLFGRLRVLRFDGCFR